MRALLVAAILLSGCATVDINDPPEPTTSTPGTPPVAGEVEGLDIAGVTWMNASIGPKAPITAFTWKIPSGASWQDGGWNARVGVLSDGSATRYAVLGFESTPAGLQYLGGSAFGPGWYRSFDDEGTETYNYTTGRPGAGLSLRADEDMAGRELVFVVAAEGTPGPLPMRVFAYTGDPFRDDHVDFVSSTKELDDLWPYTMPEAPVTGTGAGLSFGHYARIVWPWAEVDYEQVLGDVEVTIGGTAAGTVTQRYGFDAGFDKGFTVASGYQRGDGRAGTWGLSGQAHGTELADRGLVLENPDPMVGALGQLIAGYAIYNFVTEGDGQAAFTFAFDAEDLGEEQLVVFEAVSLGATLEEITGKPAAEYYHGWGTASRWTQALGPLLQP